MVEYSRLRGQLPWCLRGLVWAFLVCWPHAVHGDPGPPVWQVDYENSRNGFQARQMGVPRDGVFERLAAEAKFDPPRLEESSVVVIDIDGAHTGNADFEREIKRPKWFDVEIHPSARFETVTFRPSGGDRFEAVAKLTLRGITKEIVFPFELTIVDHPARAGFRLARAVGEVEILRLDNGIGQAEWRDIKIVAEEIVIRIQVAARRPK